MADESILPADFETEQQQEQQELEEDRSGFMPLVLLSFQTEVQEALQTALLPRAAAISQGILKIQEDVQEAGAASGAELEAAQVELGRLSHLVSSFQEAVARALQGAFMPPMA